MSDESSASASSNTHCSLISMSGSDEVSNDEVLQQTEGNILAWLKYCRSFECIVRHYSSLNNGNRYSFPTSRSGHIFILQNMYVYPQTCFQEFRIYPPMFRLSMYTIRDQYELESSTNIDIYEKVGMFLCILVHDKGIVKCKRYSGIPCRPFSITSKPCCESSLR